MAMAGTTAPSLAASHNLFAADIFQIIAPARSQENVVFSPASIQSSLALVFLGAEGETAQQIRHGLRLPAALDKTSIADDYAGFLKKNFQRSQSTSENAPTLRMANRIYVNDTLQLAPQFNHLAKSRFESEAVPTKFADSANAVKSINMWVEHQTEGKIKNLLQLDTVDSDTSAILVNAIYFKAKWLKPFDKVLTSNAEFRMSGGQTATVAMMYSDEFVKYGELLDLDATAIELPYKDSDLSMLILLPNKVDGLQELEQKLTNVDLNLIATRMRAAGIHISLPKFRIEFDIDLKKPLQKLGMGNMFSDAADFSSLFSNSPLQKIDEVKHKAFLDVNEAGSEAAAATFMKIVPMSLNLDQKLFRADHPFVFAIRNREAVYFVGHVAKF
ncbi:serine protease inhibitor 42Dd-like [Anastrepha obliqua]|uniref:serine protease inhibitor 42Dd-like n=1 Tax=Anastrepha obliqua TaxID=95512 RepID=UPI00240967B6|nr:serine protease inhibitor 42Dd-like [Anastrepha obliqua]XP_054740423.1 serine protease inhibitor 42Dd-like [Anastrepha obliqua]XP_054740424.1 serine protease inhibitor 42Dd-like [Anastrepha obliqua]XP_054740425.1 serine protease inhibitor 42Dd-like [Anastrepha obliqua]